MHIYLHGIFICILHTQLLVFPVALPPSDLPSAPSVLLLRMPQCALLSLVRYRNELEHQSVLLTDALGRLTFTLPHSAASS